MTASLFTLRVFNYRNCFFWQLNQRLFCSHKGFTFRAYSSGISYVSKCTNITTVTLVHYRTTLHKYVHFEMYSETIKLYVHPKGYTKKLTGVCQVAQICSKHRIQP